MTAPARLLARACCLAAALPLVLSAQSPTPAHTVDGSCSDRSPIPASALSGGVPVAGCPLVGRVVYAGRAAVVVPPAGVTVTGEGVSRHGDVRSLRVSNTRGHVHAFVRSRSATLSPRRASPPACRDRTFHLEPGARPWVTSFRYRTNLTKAPADQKRKTLVKQIKIANVNVRKGRNDCGKPILDTPVAHYLGSTRVRPHITVDGGFVSCGSYDTKNVVAFGRLPGGLLGWTCNWWSGSAHVSAADILLDNAGRMATTLPDPCTDVWDFEGLVTHEMGHVYALAHTGSGHAHLTMQHELTPCSTYARTLGLGDWLGMKKMYGTR